MESFTFDKFYYLARSCEIKKKKTKATDRKTHIGWGCVRV